MVTATTNFYRAALNLHKVFLEQQWVRQSRQFARAFYREKKEIVLDNFTRYEYLFSDNYRRLTESGAVVTYPDLGHVEANQIYIDGVLSGQSFQETYLQVSRVFDRMVRESKDDPTGSNRLISGYEKKVIQVYNDFGSGCLDIIRTNFGTPAETSSLIDKYQVKLMKSVRKMLNKQVPKFWQQGVDWAEINLEKAKNKEEYVKPDIYIDPNQAAIDALIERNLGYIKGLTEDAKKEILSELTEGMIRGEGIDQLVKRLAPYVDAGKGKGQSRAEMIARTEVMYGLNQGAIKRYGKDGIEKVQWLAGPDNRMCPVCGEKNGSVYKIGTEPSLPYHPNCLLPDTRCKAAGDIVSGLRSRYNGPIFEIITATGSKISVTPNHMFLTTHGFCAAQFLREGDDIINCSGFERIVTETPDDHQAPTRIEDIFNSLIESGSMASASMPIASEDLHGDARFTDGNIDIVFSNRFLEVDLESIFKKHFSGGNFDPACKSEIPFFSLSPLYEFLFSAAFASDGGMSGSRQSEPIFRCRGSHSGIHSFTPVSGSDSILLQDSDDNRSGNIISGSKTLNRFSGIKPLNNTNNWGLPASVSSPNLNSSSFENPTNGLYSRFVNLSDLFSRFSGFVKLDNIISIRILPYSGYVYDLQTLSTLYLGNSFLISNCRCTWVPYFGDEKTIEEWANEYRNADVEHYAVYDENGNIVDQGVGNKQEVEIKGDVKNKTVIHNHPGQYADMSPGDFNFAYHNNPAKMIITGENGTITITKPANGWPSGEEAQKAMDKGFQESQRVIDSFKKKWKEGVWTYEEAEKRAKHHVAGKMYENLGIVDYVIES